MTSEELSLGMESGCWFTGIELDRSQDDFGAGFDAIVYLCSLSCLNVLYLYSHWLRIGNGFTPSSKGII